MVVRGLVGYAGLIIVIVDLLVATPAHTGTATRCSDFEAPRTLSLAKQEWGSWYKRMEDGWSFRERN